MDPNPRHADDSCVAKSATSFTGGKSGNPGGRPKGIERVIREQVAAFKASGVDGAEIDGWTAIARRLIETATGSTVGAKVADEVSAAKLLYERSYGKPKETVEIVDGPPPPEIDWSAVPLEKRKRLLAAMEEVEQLAHASCADEAVEH